ncbi:glycosyltransferase family 2 protein [Sporomusa malonica]|uniref:Glycosyltransferase involved in cell wall bisynthesis n=1 Tax=Sporomusa malonica TaxID=112901 RepID=A0A1W2DKZ0_9FIRM|nr:glycosyltransferase [Sporomusa malonica]SMC98083.1 Glycosyltransferase involved in cell wall bisynthesis [Sporomusa malonica]
MPVISVIVPVYKAERHLIKCIDSILAQTFSDFELILVDDGSPDSCPGVCDQYREKDTRVKVIHQNNSGVSIARNVGIYHAQGDYIVFVDSDDYVGKTYLERLYKGYELEADIAICGYYTVYNNQRDLACIDETLPAEYLGVIKDCFKNIIKNRLLYSPWNKMYKLKIIKENHILFDPNMSLGEDLCFNIAYLYFCNNCFLCNLPLYHYIKSNSSLSRITSISYFTIQKHLYTVIEEFICKKNIDYDLSNEIGSLLNDTIGSLAILKNNSNKHLIKVQMRKILQDYLVKKYTEKIPSNINLAKILTYLLLKTQSITVILTYFTIKNKIGKMFNEDR